MNNAIPGDEVDPVCLLNNAIPGDEVDPVCLLSLFDYLVPVGELLRDHADGQLFPMPQRPRLEDGVPPDEVRLGLHVTELHLRHIITVTSHYYSNVTLLL